MALAAVGCKQLLSVPSPSSAVRRGSYRAVTTSFPRQLNSGSTIFVGIVVALGTLLQRRRRRRQKRSLLSRAQPCGITQAAATTSEEDTDGRIAIEPAPQRRKRNTRNALIMLAYIICDISMYLAGDHASKDFTKQTLLFASALTSVVFGTGLSLLQQGQKGLQDCWNPRNVLRFLPVSFCFCLSLLALLMAFPHFDGGFIKLIGQMKLPLTAFLSAFVLGQSYTLVQWQIILLICVACTSLAALKMDNDLAIGSVPFLRLFSIPAWIGFNVLGSLLAERVFKTQTNQHFTTMLTNLRIGELIVASGMLFLVPGFHLRDFFHGWNSTTLVVLVASLADTWVSGLMVKTLSSVTKIITKSCTLVLLYCFGLMTGKQPVVVVQLLGAMMIIQTSALFAVVSNQDTTERPRRRLPTRLAST